MTAYGYFDDPAHEYILTRPDTPQPWSMYSGDRKYGAIYTQHATGYSFTRSPSKGRLLRYSYVLPPAAQPGRYFYLRDAADGDFWSSSWRPVAKPLSEYETRCHMGTAYMCIKSRYRKIATETTYFVPLEQEFEYWVLQVRNEDKETRVLDCFSYAEFTSVWDIFHDEFNQQYANAIAVCHLRDGMADGGNMPHMPMKDDFGERHQSRWWYMLQGGDVMPHAHEFERDTFLGDTGSYANPEAVRNGSCRNSEAYGDTASGVFQSRLTLQPGEMKTLVVIVGAGKAEQAGKRIRAEFASVGRAEEELLKLKTHWRQRLGAIHVHSPDAAFNSMVNVWGAYNAFMTFEWSRSCSLVYTGMDRDGYGYRDTVQDILGVLPSIPDLSKERLKLMLSGQESLGGAQPVVDPVFFKAGKMPLTDPVKQRADDCMWYFNTIPAYVAETGDLDFYHEVIPYADHGEGTVYQHLRKAIEFNLNHLGERGLACGLHADWNDCITLGFRGESLFVSFQLRLALVTFSTIATQLNRPEDIGWAQAELEKLDRALKEHSWDGKWFKRAFTESGEVFGSRESPEGQIFLNPQSWAVISGAATPEQAESAMDQVENRLSCEYGLALHDSCFVHTDWDLMHAVLYLKGAKENGGIFQHTQSWAVIADCLLGHGARAYQHHRAYMPAAQNSQAGIRQVEPYVYAQWTHTRESPKPGRSRLPWLSGTAAWSYFSATHYILGLRPEPGGLRIDPCIPPEWTGFEMERSFRGARIYIRVENPEGLEHGVRCLRLESGGEVQGSLLPLHKLKDGLKVTAVMGR
ncbi:MAG: glycosyl hydrolase family 65 protein [Kiritimatiellia bacterium]